MHEDFLPTASLERLTQRAAILKTLREFFDQHHFIEVETPILSHDTCVDRYLQPIGVPSNELWASPDRPTDSENMLWLQTSPEFGMKRILAAGATAIFQITKAFRSGERGRLHNPEFTMLEWYRVGHNLHTGMDFLSELIAKILPVARVDRITYQDLFQSHLGFDPHRTNVGILRRVCQQHELAVQSSFLNETDHDVWLNLLLSQVIEPALKDQPPTIVFDWPASQSALAIVRDESPPVAERFELYVEGVEIANGYHELLEVNELERRNQINNHLRQQDGVRPLPANSRLLSAMRRGIQPCAGVALGVDRLVMLATGALTIDEVLAFPIERA